MPELRQLFSSTLLYGSIGATSALMSAMLVPLYTRVFSPAQYGAVSLVAAAVALLSALTVLGLDTAAARWFNLQRASDDRSVTVATWVAAYTVMSVTAAAVLAAAARWLAIPLTGSGRDATAIRWAAASMPLGVPATVALTVLRLQNRRVATVSIGLCLAIVSASSAALLVGVGKIGVSGIFIGQCIGATASSAVALLLMGSWLNPLRANRQRLIAMLGFSMPLIPAAVANWVTNLLDRYVVRAVSGPREVGFYQVAYALAALTALATTAFQLAWGPFAFGIAEEPHAPSTYSRAMLAYVAAASWLAAAIGAVAPEAFPSLVPAQYAHAATAVPALAMSYVLIGLTYVAAIGPSIAGTSVPVAVGTMIAGVATLPLLGVLVPTFGVEGAAVATFAAWCLQPMWVFWRGRTLWPVPYSYVRAAVLIATALATGQALNTWRSGQVGWILAGKALVLVALALALAAVTLHPRRLPGRQTASASSVADF